MKQVSIGALLGTVLLGLAACNDNHTPPFAGAFRIANGIGDSNGVSASATSGFPSTAAVNFDSAGSIVAVPDGIYNVQLFDGSSGNPFNTVNNVSVSHNNLTTLFTSGSISGGTGSGFAAVESLSQPASGQFTFQFANDTTRALNTPLDVYLIAPGSTILGKSAIASANSGSAANAVAVPAGTYEIVVASGGVPVFDSGATNSGVVLPPVNSNVVELGALDATSAQSSGTGSTITLLLMDNSGGETLHLNNQN